MTDLNYDAFEKLTKRDINAFLTANQDELNLTDAVVKSFLVLKIDGNSFLNLTEDELKMRLQVPERAAQRRIMMLINKIRASTATAVSELESATPENSRLGTQTRSGSSSVATQIYSTGKTKPSFHQKGYVYWGDSALEVFSQEYCWSSLRLDLRLDSGPHGSTWRGTIDGQHAVIKLYDLQKGEEKYWSTEMEVYSLLKDLQGVMIPQVNHCGTVDGMAGFIGMTFCEKICTSVSPEDICLLRKTISKLHAKKIAHGDIRLENLTKSEDGQIWLINFGFAQTNADDDLLQDDWSQLEALPIED